VPGWHSYQTTFAYDQAGRLIRESVENDAEGSYYRTYTYDANGNRVSDATQASSAGLAVERDFENGQLPAEITPALGTWNVLNGRLLGTGTGSAKAQVGLPPNALLPYSVKLQVDETAVTLDHDAQAGFSLGQTENGRYVISARIFKVDNQGVEEMRRGLRLLYIPIINGVDQPAEVISDSGSQLHSAEDWLTLLVEIYPGYLSAELFHEIAGGAYVTQATLAAELAHGGQGGLGLEVRHAATDPDRAHAKFDDLRWYEATGETATRNYTYNALNQLLHVTGAETIDFQYDVWGNLIQEIKETGEPNQAITEYQYDRLNRMVRVLNAQADSRYAYHGATWMRTAITGTGAATFSYDGFACVKMTAGGADTYYCVPNQKPLYETSSKTNTTSIRHYASDGLGNVAGHLTKTGMDTRFRYDAFGNLRTYTKNAEAGNYWVTADNTSGPRYKGQLYDSDTAKVYLRNRMYTPSLGRFTRMDPAGMVDGPNMYAYAGGDPVNNWDPTGLEWHVYIDEAGEIVVDWIDEGDGYTPTQETNDLIAAEFDRLIERANYDIPNFTKDNPFVLYRGLRAGPNARAVNATDPDGLTVRIPDTDFVKYRGVLYVAADRDPLTGNAIFNENATPADLFQTYIYYAELFGYNSGIGGASKLGKEGLFFVNLIAEQALGMNSLVGLQITAAEDWASSPQGQAAIDDLRSRYGPGVALVGTGTAIILWRYFGPKGLAKGMEEVQEHVDNPPPGALGTTTRRSAQAAARIKPRHVSLTSIADNPDQLRAWQGAIDDLYSSTKRTARGGVEGQAVKDYVNTLRAGRTPNGEQARAAFESVRKSFHTRLRNEGIPLPDSLPIHHWNWDITRYADQALNPHNLFPVLDRGQHTLVHRLTSSGSSPFADPVAGLHEIFVPHWTTYLPGGP
jgi:RHS repeat-associated protein